MAKDVNEVIKATIDQLSSLPEKELSQKEVCDFIESQIKQAFKQVGEDGRNELFKKLSLVLAQDRLPIKNSALFNYLQPLGLTPIPQQIVNKFQKKDNYTELEGLTLRQKITKNVTIAGQKFLYFLASLPEKHHEYVQPFKNFAKIAIFLNYLVVGALIIALLPAGIGIGLCVLGGIGINLIQQFIFNKINNNRFVIEKDTYIETAKYAEARKVYLSKFRDIYVAFDHSQCNLYEMNDDEFMDYHVLVLAQCHPAYEKNQAEIIELIKKDVKNDIKNKIYVNFLTRIRLSAKTILHNLLKPLPQGIFKKLTFIAIRPLQLLASTFLLASIACVEAFYSMIFIIGLGGFALTYGVYVSGLLLINTPLFVIDAFRACFMSADSEEPSLDEEEESEYYNASSSTMLTIMPPSASINYSVDNGESSQSLNDMNNAQYGEECDDDWHNSRALGCSR